MLERALRFTLAWEGGLVDDPDDLGGRTAYGITQRTYTPWRRSQGLPERDVWEIERWEVRAIYEAGYWTPFAGTLTMPSAMLAFDFSVHSGVRRARAIWQAGPEPTAYLEARWAWFDTIVAARPRQQRFLRGWRNRVAALAVAAGIAWPRGLSWQASQIPRPRRRAA